MPQAVSTMTYVEQWQWFLQLRSGRMWVRGWDENPHGTLARAISTPYCKCRPCMTAADEYKERIGLKRVSGG